MTFSDALPVQWWLAECETYNEHEPEGVHYNCWCQPWNCGMAIPVQFKHTTGGSYTLRIISEGGAQSDYQIDEVLPGVYQATFTPSETSPDYCQGRIKMQVIDDGDSQVKGKTDCIEVASAHAECVEITYSNTRNYNGIVYEDQSPDLSFSILVPGRFYHEREVEEDNAIELTSSIVTTSSQVKTQRLLEVKHSPYYFHKKLRRVLQHKSVTILSKEWKKEEAYNTNEGNMRWPLKSATVFLTDRDSVVRNVL